MVLFCRKSNKGRTVIPHYTLHNTTKKPVFENALLLAAIARREKGGTRWESKGSTSTKLLTMKTIRDLNGGTRSIHLGIRTPPFLPSFFSSSKRISLYSSFSCCHPPSILSHIMIILKHNTLSANDLFSIERVRTSITTPTFTMAAHKDTSSILFDGWTARDNRLWIPISTCLIYSVPIYMDIFSASLQSLMSSPRLISHHHKCWIS